MFQGRTIGSIATVIAIIALSWPATLKAQSPAASDVSVAGRWQGTRSATGGSGSDAFKIHSIRLDLKQSGEEITGSYRCYAGKHANTDCNNPVGNVTSGTIKDGKVNIKVQAMPNNLQCSFDGSVEGSEMKGDYTCYVGGGLATNGVFDVHRKE
jgi:hypothetical protein